MNKPCDTCGNKPVCDEQHEVCDDLIKWIGENV